MNSETVSAVSVPRENLSVYRVVASFLLASLLVKIVAWPAFYWVYGQLPIDDPFFPLLLRTRSTLALAQITAVTSVLFSIFVTNGRVRCRLMAMANVCLLILCTHQGSYNDVTFVTCWWCSLWCIWFISKMHQPWHVLAPHAMLLGQLIISLVFLGGAVGKWTAGYWSGEVLYDIFFADRDFWIFNLLRNKLPPNDLRTCATGYSRAVIVAESLGALLWLLPHRVAARASIVLLLGIVMLSNVFLLSVVLCLIGLAIVGMQELTLVDSRERGPMPPRAATVREW